MDRIVCPHCGKNVELSEAITHELSQKVRREEQEKNKAQLEKAVELARAQTEKEAKEEVKKELEQASKQNQSLEQRLLKEEKSRLEFEKKAQANAQQEALKTSRLDRLEYEKKIKDMQQALEDAQRKAKQGSQQLQGEVLELDLEEQLRKAFPADEFLPVPKGVEGADIWEKVKFNGKVVGSIIWEIKRTKEWRPIWLGKLKDDSARVNASEAVIVSQVLPEGTDSFDRKDGVWITSYDHAVSIARYVRFLITTIASVKSSTSHSDEEWSQIRDYMLSDSFQHRIHTHLNAVKNLRDMLTTEQRTSTLRWTRQQKQIDKLDSNIVNFYGELKDIVHNLPELEETEVPLLEDENNQETLI